MDRAEKGAKVLDGLIAARPKVNGARHYAEAIGNLYANGMPAGDKTGWPSVDRHYTVVPGQLTIISGYPGSGKSEWLDALLINLARQGWRTAIFSPENKPTELHIAKLMEKIGGRPFGHGPTARLTEREVIDYTNAISEWFGFIEASDEEASSIDAVMAAATPWLEEQTGHKRGLVIDPWNELDHWRPTNLTESEYISKTLSTVRNWARRTSVHVWIVAHPQKMRREEGKLPVPRPDMVSGAAHWWNKADAAITVYRDLEKLDSQEVEIHVQKIRFKHVGRPGLVLLDYDRITGRYHEQAAFKHIRGVKSYERD